MNSDLSSQKLFSYFLKWLICKNKALYCVVFIDSQTKILFELIKTYCKFGKKIRIGYGNENMILRKFDFFCLYTNHLQVFNS